MTTSRPPLDLAALRRELPEYRSIDVVEATESTNTDLVAAAKDGAPEGAVLAAEHQTAGRGRAGRGWLSPPRSSITMSVLLRPVEVPQSRWGWLSPLVGVVACRAIQDLCGLDAVLKWPNDVLLGERKCAGILGELAGGPDPAVVVGIGLNVSLSSAELAGDPTPNATSLATSGAATTDRTALTIAVLRRLHDEQRRWRAQGGDPEATGLAEAYRARCTTLHRDITAIMPNGARLRGLASDVDAEGRLVVLGADGTRHAVSAADVTHVRPGAS